MKSWGGLRAISLREDDHAGFAVAAKSFVSRRCSNFCFSRPPK
jgi:hypothetical protein